MKCPNCRQSRKLLKHSHPKLNGLCKACQKYGSRYLVYEHLDHTGEVFYVGSGVKGRPYEINKRTTAWKTKAANGWTVNIVKTGLVKDEAQALEQELIGKHSKTLVNIRTETSRKGRTAYSFRRYLTDKCFNGDQTHLLLMLIYPENYTHIDMDNEYRIYQKLAELNLPQFAREQL